MNAPARPPVISAAGLHSEDGAVELVEPTQLLDGAPPLGDVSEAIARGLEQRPELAEKRLGADAALHLSRARGWSLLPEVDFEAAYLRLDGQVFAPPNSAFVGARASWPIWEWGATWNARRAARAMADAAREEVEGQTRTIEVDVVSRRAQLEASSSAVGLARETIASAVEAYRVTDALLRAGAATTTDLLDAQAALTPARHNRARARDEEAIARVTLERAEGK